MSLGDGMLTNAIIGTLNEPAVSMINFKVGAFQIGTMHYGMIASMIGAGVIKCRVDPGKVPNGAAAIWDGKNIIAVRSDAFYADEKQTFVHESTHAIIQTIAGFSPGGMLTVKILNNEVAAFLAASIYVVASQQQASYKDPNSPVAVAFQLVSKKQLGPTPTNAKSPVVFSDQEIATLVTAIKKNAQYKNWDENQDLRRFW